jgi:hypothetical protein
MIAFLFATTAAFGKSDEDEMADFYLNNPIRWVGKLIAVECAVVSKVSRSEETAEVVAFRATTYTRRGIYGGTILVYVPSTDVDAFIFRYGIRPLYRRGRTAPITKTLEGVFTKGPGGYFLDRTGIKTGTPAATAR